MSSALRLSSFARPSVGGCGRRSLQLLFSTPHPHTHCQEQHHQLQSIRLKHQVRVILTRDLPPGQMRNVYAGEVHHVAAGYARNYLLPKKLAVYATPANFERCGVVDPDIVAMEKAMEAKAMGDEEAENLKWADLLRRYLRNKTVRIIRNVDLNAPTICHPGHVSAANLREKLSKQLKIDLEEHETIRILNEPQVGLEEMEEEELMKLIGGIDGGEKAKAVDSAGDDTEGGTADGEGDEVPSVGDDIDNGVDRNKDCDTKVKQLGDYVAKITLAGGFEVPLKFRVERR